MTKVQDFVMKMMTSSPIHLRNLGYSEVAYHSCMIPPSNPRGQLFPWILYICMAVREGWFDTSLRTRLTLSLIFNEELLDQSNKRKIRRVSSGAKSLHLSMSAPVHTREFLNGRWKKGVKFKYQQCTSRVDSCTKKQTITGNTPLGIGYESNVMQSKSWALLAKQHGDAEFSI